MRAGAVAAGIRGDGPRSPCGCLGWVCSRKLLVLTGRAEGRESFEQAHLEHLVPGWVCAAPSGAGSPPQPPEHPQPRCGHFLPTLPSYECREEILAGDLTTLCRVPEERIRLSPRWRGSISFLPSFLPGGAGAVWHGRRGDRRGSCSGRGLGCFKHQLLFLTHVPECRWLWQTGIYRDDHTDAAGRLWEQGGNHSPGNFYPHLLLVIIFCSRSPVGKPYLKN